MWRSANGRRRHPDDRAYLANTQQHERRRVKGLHYTDERGSTLSRGHLRSKICAQGIIPEQQQTSFHICFFFLLQILLQ